MSVIACDIDGVLADFTSGYAPLLTKHSGIEFPRLGEEGWPDTWFWERAAGVTKEQEDLAWADISASSWFWYDLPPNDGVPYFLECLSVFDDVYFITHRSVGKDVKRQTEDWLKNYGFDAHPTVLISQEKGLACKALKVNYYLDDKNENCFDVWDHSPDTKGFMLKKGWNEEIDEVPRLETLQEFLDVIRRGDYGAS